MLIGLVPYMLNWLINAYMFILFVRMIVDWMFVLGPNWYPRGIFASIISIIYRLTDPPLRWLRRYIPPLPLGRIQLDVSFLVLWFALVVLQSCINFVI